ncbi:transposase [Leadbettera azotonutricia]|uniref:Transposase n=1 Tax=Leadbettera azotonutricia (strain ATCC BAA-888 / DSM 13862 / ZAS-9) TaxID=545695 RepID=F5YBJ8_LEAAZ|nr:transposase [Leadbettera azotonutricia]AEF82559.1 transposase [Leadbettera azotonutricia ZAS-9]
MGEKRTFTKEFKERAVELALKAERKQSEIAAGLGIDGNTLSRWKREAREAEGGTLKAFPGKGKARDEEVARLKRENEDLRETNEILKKAMVIFTAKTPR